MHLFIVIKEPFTENDHAHRSRAPTYSHKLIYTLKCIDSI